jgi:hypothetical protein
MQSPARKIWDASFVAEQAPGQLRRPPFSRWRFGVGGDAHITVGSSRHSQLGCRESAPQFGSSAQSVPSPSIARSAKRAVALSAQSSKEPQPSDQLAEELAEAEASWRECDTARLREASHRLAGMVAFASSSAGQVASDLESEAAAGRLNEAGVLLERLRP